ncbi:MAG TPA: hypothetical protein VMH87_12170, partial [Pseudomonadales bacterium]|nr:hypothetical protein [Pseudomonadales bacterium]
MHAAQSEWVYLNASNRLEYKTLPQGDLIMDFSYAGYSGGGVAIPGVPAVITVSSSGGDDTTNIQNAIDAASQMPLTNGFRGAVLLNKGIFYCSGTLHFKTSGVVLRGYGTGVPGTMIRMTTEPHLCVSVEGTAPEESREHIAITDKYVPSGAMSFHVADASSFKPGDAIFIFRPATPAWVAFMGMNDLVRSGKKEHWVGDTITRRTVAAVSGNTITLDVPLSDSFDSQYLNPPGAWVVHSSISGWIHHVGVENLR